MLLSHQAALKATFGLLPNFVLWNIVLWPATFQRLICGSLSLSLCGHPPHAWPSDNVWSDLSASVKCKSGMQQRKKEPKWAEVEMVHNAHIYDMLEPLVPYVLSSTCWHAEPRSLHTSSRWVWVILYLHYHTMQMPAISQCTQYKRVCMFVYISIYFICVNACAYGAFANFFLHENWSCAGLGRTLRVSCATTVPFEFLVEHILVPRFSARFRVVS